jgi:MFS family permease
VSPSRHRHHLTAFSFFLVLGFQVGAWTVQLAPLAGALRLSPGPLGLALTAVAAAGVVTLFAGRRLADRVGRRAVLLLGFGGTALAYALLSLFRGLGPLIAVFVLYGLFVSFVDLGANTVGADHERAHRVHAMTGLHAGFSLGALLGAAGAALALAAGAGFRTVYLALAVLLAGAAGYAAMAPLPPPSPNAWPAGSGSGGSPASRSPSGSWP